MKKFMVKDQNGNMHSVNQYGTFVYHINGRTSFRIVITETLGRLNSFTVVDRNSTGLITTFSAFELIAARHDYVAAAKVAIDKLIERVGIDRFIKTLKEASSTN